MCVCACDGCDPPALSLIPTQCYLFHMYVGVRAGGGIGDEIEDPAGDEYELYRVIFDITFFFFVIVILLAIIQGEPAGSIAAVFRVFGGRAPGSGCTPPPRSQVALIGYQRILWHLSCAGFKSAVG